MVVHLFRSLRAMEPAFHPIAVILCIDGQLACLLSRTLVLESEGYSVLSVLTAVEGLKRFVKIY
jgi:hypothetical protein